MSISKKGKSWFKPLMEFDDEPPKKKSPERITDTKENAASPQKAGSKLLNINHKNWMKNFDPVKVEDLAVHTKKVQEVEQWMQSMSDACRGDMLLLTGPVGCGKTVTVETLAAKYNFKVTEWITPLDIDMPTEYGDYEFREKQSTKFRDFIINAANFTSLLDNNSKKLVLVEDFPNTFTRTPSEFSDVLEQYKNRAKSPIVFICSELHSDNKNSVLNLFSPQLKEKFNIQHISFNSVSPTGLKSALKRVSEIISKKYSSVYTTPGADLIDCVINSSAGDVRSAVLNLHFACLKGSNSSLEKSQFLEKENKSKATKKKKSSNKFTSLGKDQTVSILHGVGRVLNPKVIQDGEKQRLSHAPAEVIEQFLSQPSSFVNFLHENYLPHFSCVDHAQRAAAALSDADYMLSEWRERVCQEFGLYIATAGLMLSNKAPVSAWNPVRGPKNMKIQYPSITDIPLLDPDYLYKGKVLVTDYKTLCNIINKC
ncbi:cell cycle checkpoint protein RAD17 [Plutella xylostella]|uniref:cell cycle checkpoint protein RAD17 n=1 Tax=Plutella xylostella TaxID=51655 RepID=UPI0020326A22|nr:cell cycle checkpoint protein RAD17 [Plutella xylostella]